LVPNTNLYASTGDRILVTPEALEVGGLTMAGNEFHRTNSMLAIGQRGSLGID
jgi:hypothetical protein